MTQPFVDPDTAALLARMAVDFAGAPQAPTVEERRQGLEVVARLYGPQEAPIERMEMAAAPGPDGPISLWIYHPIRERAGPVPLVVHIHGGGWVLGGPEAYERVVRAYCSAGECVVVDVAYRRAPEHKHPAALRDCLAALEWAAANAGRLGADAGRIIVTGDSAGGHLAAAVCQLASVNVSRQILVYPVMTASEHAQLTSRKTLGDGRFFLREFDILRAEQEYFTASADRERSPASPLLAPASVLRLQPPTVVFTAGLDPLLDEGRAYVEAIRTAGGVADEILTDGVIHGFVLFAGEIGWGRRVIAEIGALVRDPSLKPASLRPGRPETVSP